MALSKEQNINCNNWNTKIYGRFIVMEVCYDLQQPPKFGAINGSGKKIIASRSPVPDHTFRLNSMCPAVL